MNRLKTHLAGKERYSSITNALRLLHAFSADEPELGISELAERLGLAKSTVHRLLTTLAGEGFIAKNPHTHLYRLGVSVLALGNVVTSGIELHNHALPILSELVQKSGETSHIGLLRGTEVVYIHKEECAHPVRLLSHLGKRNPAHCTSSGQAILAFQEDSVVDRVIAAGLFPYTRNTITCPNRLKERLAQVRECGYAVCREELHEGVVSIAAPIRNRTGHVVASVSIAGPIQRITPDGERQLAPLVVRAAQAITARLLGAGPRPSPQIPAVDARANRFPTFLWK